MICDCGICRSPLISFRPQVRSGPTRMGRIHAERASSSLRTRKTGNGQSPQNFRKNCANGRQASKNGSQLETTIAIESAKSFSCFIGETYVPTRLTPKDSRGAAHGWLDRIDVP